MMNNSDMLLMKLHNSDNFELPITENQQRMISQIDFSNNLLGYVRFVGDDHPAACMPYKFDFEYYKFKFIWHGSIMAYIEGTHPIKGNKTTIDLCLVESFGELIHCYEELSDKGIWFRYELCDQKIHSGHKWDLMMGETRFGSKPCYDE